MNTTFEMTAKETGIMTAFDLEQRHAFEGTVGDYSVVTPRMQCRNVAVYYGEKHAIRNVSLDIGKHEVVSMIGPSGCGKSTFLRCLNRMNDEIPGCRVTGTIKLDGVEIYDKKQDVVPLRAQVGMVFQKPNPFPKSVYENVAYGPRIHGITNNKAELDGLVETSLCRAGSGTKSRTGWTSPEPSFPGASSSACASPAPSLFPPR